jgi:hypothetical protein
LSKLTPLLTDNPRIAPIKISKETIPVGSTCQIFGWGLPLSLRGSHEMLRGDITIVNNSLCDNPANSFCGGPDHVYPCAGSFFCLLISVFINDIDIEHLFILAQVMMARQLYVTI